MPRRPGGTSFHPVSPRRHPAAPRARQFQVSVLESPFDITPLPTMKQLRMLYVEDNDELRETFQEMLEGEQREVVACATAEEALVLWEASHFDVLVSDISLPGMSGTDLARRIIAKDPERWVVLCSGYQHGDALQALGPRVRELAKPFELDDLDRLMDEIRSSHDSTP